MCSLEEFSTLVVEAVRGEDRSRKVFKNTALYATVEGKESTVIVSDRDRSIWIHGKDRTLLQKVQDRAITLEQVESILVKYFGDSTSYTLDKDSQEYYFNRN